MLQRPPGLGKAILVTGLLAGTLDISAAIINFLIPDMRNPVLVFQYIASGMFGMSTAFTGGWLMAFVGLVLHYCIATYWTAVYYYAYPAIKRFAPNKVTAGVAYGILVWLAMNLVVLPLSRVPKMPLNPKQAIIGALILMVAIGLPISMRAASFYRRSATDE